jgi:hypothetical protein
MGSSLTGLDTLFSSGREFWSSWQLDCSQPGGGVPSNGSNVWGSRTTRKSKVRRPEGWIFGQKASF